MSDSPDPTAPQEELPPASEAESFAHSEPQAPEEIDGEIEDESDFDFAPVLLRHRYDGWTPDKQLGFIERLTDCGCVEEAARSVGMSRNSAYALRRRPDAQAFRLAWEAAQDAAVARLNDAALSRAINGVPVPIFHGGELVGERRHFDERLTMFLLRYRDPVRYGKWIDGTTADQAAEGPLLIFLYRLMRLGRAAWAAFEAALDGQPAPKPPSEDADTAPAHSS